MVRDFYSTRDCPNTRNTAQQHTLTTHDFGALWSVPLDFQLRFFLIFLLTLFIILLLFFFSFLSFCQFFVFCFLFLVFVANSRLS